MPVDPQNPDTFDESADGTDASAATGGTDTPAVPDGETPEADAAEQRTEVEQREDLPLGERQSDEVDPADAAEQARVVELNEDEYR